MDPAAKKARKSLSLLTKIQILDYLAAGETVGQVSRKFDVAHSTITTIKKNECQIRQAVIRGADISGSRSAYIRDPCVERMEKALLIWIDDNQQKNIPMSGEIIKEKALGLYSRLQKDEASTSTKQKREFVASSGWLANFVKRFSLHNVAVKGESASADNSAAAAFPNTLAKIIDDGHYNSDQVFNMDETGLFWKKMPSRTYITMSQKFAKGYKVAKERITLLMCSNASGDFCLKPLVVHRTLRPRALKDSNMDMLPVHWRANPKAWVTKLIFEDWFAKCFVPEVKEYLTAKGHEFKVGNLQLV